MLSLTTKDTPEFLLLPSGVEVEEPGTEGVELKAGNRCGKSVVGRAEALSKKFGLRAGQIVVVEARSSRASIETIFACFKLGLDVVLLPERLTAFERTQYLDSLDYDLFLTSTGESGVSEGYDFSVEKSERDLGIQQTSRVLFFTSGSAGKPKIVVHRLESLLRVAAASNTVTQLNSSGRWLLTLPISHTGGFSILLRSLLAGAKVCLPTNFRLANLYRHCILFQPTHISLVPTMLRSLVESWQQKPLTALKAVLVSGAPLGLDLQKRAIEFGVPIICSYGLTEAGSTVCSTGVLQSVDKVGQAGRCLSGVELQVVNQTLEGGTGEIQLRGENLFEGYLGSDSPNKFLNKWFSTGDLGLINSQGNLEIVGRASRMFISGGENVNPREIEELVRGLEWVRDAAVVAVPSDKWGERPVLFVELQEVKDSAEECLAQFLGERLSAAGCPEKIEVVSEIPKLEVGKTDYFALRELLGGGSLRGSN